MATSGDGQNSEGGRSLLILLGTPSVVSALGGTALVLIIFTFSLSVVCLLSKRRKRARTPLRLPQDANPDTEHRQASETLNTEELEASPTPHPPIPVYVTEWLIPPVVSKASNETETTILDDGDSESQSEAGSVFEEEIVVTGTCGLSSPMASMTQTPTPELPRRTSDMYITADGLSSVAQTPELPRRTNDMYITADGLSCRSCSVPPDLPPRSEALSCCSGSHDGGLSSSAENLLHTQSASIKSLLAEDYNRLETFRGKNTERKSNSAIDTDIPTGVNNHSNGVVTVDIAEMSGDNLDDKNTDKATSELANHPSTSAFSNMKEPLLSVQEDNQPTPFPPPIPPKVKSSHSVVRMERPNTGKRAPRPPPAIRRASSDVPPPPPPPPLPPKGVPHTEKPNIALPPRNIRRNVNSVEGNIPQAEGGADEMALKFNASYQTFVEHFYHTK